MEWYRREMREKAGAGGGPQGRSAVVQGWEWKGMSGLGFGEENQGVEEIQSGNYVTSIDPCHCSCNMEKPLMDYVLYHVGRSVSSAIASSGQCLCPPIQYKL